MQTYNREVDSWGHGPAKLVIVGPPGTGKTRTALEDFLLPALRDTSPDRVLACSFSNVAADEIRNRLALRLGVGDSTLRETCSTIHSEALRRYRRFGDSTPRLYDPTTRTSKLLKREIAPDGEARPAVDLWAAAADAWDYIRSVRADDDPNYKGLCNLRRFTRNGKFLASELRACIEAFQQDKGRDGSIDFTDMLTKALGYEGRELDLLLIDEANDCTPLQWALIDHWSIWAKNIVVIGDHDQAIHRWMGAAPDLLLERIRTWDARVLSQSWRVPVVAHSAARWLISRVDDREDAEYLPRDHGGSAAVIGWEGVVSRLHELAAQHVAMPEVFAGGELTTQPGPSAFVLCRTNMQVSGVRRMLNAAGLPYPFAPTTAARVYAAITLCAGEVPDDHSLNLLAAKLPARYFTGTKKAAMEGDVLKSLKREMFTDPADALGDIQGIAGDKGYWLKVCERYPAWVLKDPPPFTVMTMHASKGAEADVVFVNADKPYSVERVDDDELRLLYVSVTRTRDELYVWGEGYAELHHAIAQAGTGEVPF